MADKAAETYNYFINRGYSPEAAAAIVGHFDYESGFNTKAIHDQGSGFGVAGWRDEKPGKGRKTQLMEFARKNRMNPNSLETQLRYTDYELNGSEKKAGARLKNATTVQEANDAMMHFERPQGYSSKNIKGGMGYGDRLSRAKNALSSYGGSAVDSGEIVDNTDTEAIPTNEMKWDEPMDDVADKAATESTPTIKSRIKQGITGLIKSLSDSDDPGAQPFDYTPAGESNVDTNYNPDEGGVDPHAYTQYSGYSEGGNVEESIDPYEYFAMVIGAR